MIFEKAICVTFLIKETTGRGFFTAEIIIFNFLKIFAAQSLPTLSRSKILTIASSAFNSK